MPYYEIIARAWKHPQRENSPKNSLIQDIAANAARKSSLAGETFEEAYVAAVKETKKFKAEILRQNTKTLYETRKTPLGAKQKLPNPRVNPHMNLRLPRFYC
jgi:hypothetical protein